MAQTFIAKGTVVTDPSYNNIGRAVFVRCVATAQSTITVDSTDSTVLGEIYLHAAGDEVTIEKHPDDRLTVTGGAKVHAVGSPRS